MLSKCAIPILIASIVTIPGIAVRLSDMHLQPPMMALIAGIAILGASFLLLWACDVAQEDISQTLAIAIVALIAVLPEYAVDIYFTWQAGKFPESNYAQYAIANMTGANRLLIGIAWGLIAVIFWIKTRRAVVIDKERRTELFFLGLATLYAFIIPMKGSLAWYDGVVLIGIFTWYMVLAGRRPTVPSEVEGPAKVLLALPTVKRRWATAGMFLFAAGAVLANAEPFAEGLVATGKSFGINEFLLVQWLAPIASEAPEFVIAIMFALRGQAGLALGSLLASKLNQWTLLVGMIPGVFALSHGSLQHPLPMGNFQMHEILLTAAQSLLAVVLLANLRLSIGHALLLFGLFFGQFLTPMVVERLPGNSLWGMHGESMHPFFSVLYFMAAATLVMDAPGRLRDLWHGVKVDIKEELKSEVCVIDGGQFRNM